MGSCISLKKERVIVVKKHKQNKHKRVKQHIPDSLKTDVWNTYIGISIGQAKCICCNNRDISQRDFHCGHVKSEATGGKLEISNLRPICAKCNLSMGKMNLFEFQKKCGYS